LTISTRSFFVIFSIICTIFCSKVFFIITTWILPPPIMTTIRARRIEGIFVRTNYPWYWCIAIKPWFTSVDFSFSPVLMLSFFFFTKTFTAWLEAEFFWNPPPGNTFFWTPRGNVKRLTIFTGTCPKIFRDCLYLNFCKPPYFCPLGVSCQKKPRRYNVSLRCVAKCL